MNDNAPLNYDYTPSRDYCAQIGLVWLGDDFVRAADQEAQDLLFTQAQVEAAMRHHLWQVKWLFTPSHYKWYQRLLLSLYFIVGWMPKSVRANGH